VTVLGRLTELNGSHAGSVHAIEAPTVTIGREGEIDIDHAEVSRQHARLTFSGGRWELTDLGSTNGTALNDQLVVGTVVVRSGDVIRLGEVHDLRFTTADETVRRPARRSARASVWVEPTSPLEARIRSTGESVAITRMESKLLSALLAAPGYYLANSDLEDLLQTDSLAKLVSRLRKKIEADPTWPTCLRTVRGLGYRLAE